jgi:hypothetical protein
MTLEDREKRLTVDEFMSERCWEERVQMKMEMESMENWELLQLSLYDGANWTRKNSVAREILIERGKQQ